MTVKSKSHKKKQNSRIQTDRQIERQTDREEDRHTDRLTESWSDSSNDRPTDSQTDTDKLRQKVLDIKRNKQISQESKIYEIRHRQTDRETA